MRGSKISITALHALFRRQKEFHNFKLKDVLEKMKKDAADFQEWLRRMGLLVTLLRLSALIPTCTYVQALQKGMSTQPSVFSVPPGIILKNSLPEPTGLAFFSVIRKTDVRFVMNILDNFPGEVWMKFFFDLSSLGVVKVQ